MNKLRLIVKSVYTFVTYVARAIRVVLFVIGGTTLLASGSLLALQANAFESTDSGTTAITKQVKTAMANPAALFCQQRGGEARTTQTEQGELGMCKLRSGQICEQWAYFRGECKDKLPPEAQTLKEICPKDENS